MPSDYPGGKQRDELSVEFTVLGIPCLGLNGGPTFKHSEALSAGFDGGACGWWRRSKKSVRGDDANEED